MTAFKSFTEATLPLAPDGPPAGVLLVIEELENGLHPCYRSIDDGYSHLDRLTDLPGYAEAMAAGRLGDLMSSGRLVRPEERRTDFAEFNRLLGEANPCY